MYCDYFGFKEKPFEISPDPEFLYLSSGHREMLAALIYGVQERRGLIAIIGEVGTGKTILLRALMETLAEKNQCAYFFSCGAGFKDFLNVTLQKLGVPGWNDNLSLPKAVDALNEFAKKEFENGGNLILILDEAQNLDRDFMENLRLLNNFEAHKKKLIQIILSGQIELDEKLKRYDLRQLAQRINMRRYIIPLNRKETNDYITHRLCSTGYCGPPLFSQGALLMIQRYSGGIPRKINVLCDNALLTAYGLDQKQITYKIIKEVIADLYFDQPVCPVMLSNPIRHFFQNKPGKTLPWVAGLSAFAGAVIITVLLVSIWPFLQPESSKLSNFSFKIESAINNPLDIKEDRQAPRILSESLSSTDPKSEEDDTLPTEVNGMSKGGKARIYKGKINPDEIMGAGVHVTHSDHPLKLKSASKSTGTSSSYVDNFTGSSILFSPANLGFELRTSVTPSLNDDQSAGSIFSNLFELPPLAFNSFSSSTGDDPNYVMVKPGDNLTKIIEQYYGHYTDNLLLEVLKANKSIIDFNLIEIGQTIKMP